MKNTPFNPNPGLRKWRGAFALLLAATFVACSSAFGASLEIGVALSMRSGPPYYSGSASYTSGGGFNISMDSQANTSFIYGPDEDLGHMSYDIRGIQTLHDPLWDKNFFGSGSAKSDWGHGGIHASANCDGDCVNQGFVRVRDNVMFNNTTGQAQPVTIRFVIHGVMSVGALYSNDGSHILCYGRAEARVQLVFAGNAQGGQVNGNFGLNSDPNSPGDNFGSITQVNWDQPGQSFEIAMDPGNRSGTFAGHFMLPPGERTYELFQTLFTDARCDAIAGYADTAGLQIIVPPGVSFTSESGKLLTGGSRLANISTRARVLGGDNVSIAGFIVTGNVPKKVIILGIGPSLSSFLPNPLPNPTLQLNRDNTVLTTNDDWKETQQTEIQNSGLAPTHNLESAIIRTLDPGNYTAILRDKDNAAGIGIVQVYDLDSGADSKLANISTRAFIEPGDNVLFAGIIGGGNGSQPKVLITARGPSLAPFGVPNPIPDPFLELHDKNGALITSNNDWESDQKDAIAATGVGPTNPKESALLATLLPAENYTAIVKDANNASGVGLVEVYHLQ
jgi:hypothetical protein